MKLYNILESVISIRHPNLGRVDVFPGAEIDTNVLGFSPDKPALEEKVDAAHKYAKGNQAVKEAYLAGFEAASAVKEKEKNND
jgi:hypothetical protein